MRRSYADQTSVKKKGRRQEAEGRREDNWSGHGPPPIKDHQIKDFDGGMDPVGQGKTEVRDSWSHPSNQPSALCHLPSALPEGQVISFQLRSLSKTLIQFMPLIGKIIRIGSALFLLSAGVPLWLITEAISPQMVQAYTARADLSLDSLPEENYETLLRRAEAAARAAAQRSFDKDILVTDVSIIVCVQNDGSIAPVLELVVSRPQWRNYPDPQRWATYFKTARSLLYFNKTLTTSTASPQPPTPAPKPTQPPLAPLPK